MRRPTLIPERFLGGFRSPILFTLPFKLSQVRYKFCQTFLITLQSAQIIFETYETFMIQAATPILRSGILVKTKHLVQTPPPTCTASLWELPP